MCKTYWKKKGHQTPFFPSGFIAFKQLLISVENRQFLDEYIVRTTSLESIQDPIKKAKFDLFSNRIEELKKVLESAGIDGVKPNQEINFWSGKEGQEMAAADAALSDSDVPLFKFLFSCWGCIKKDEMTTSLDSSIVELISLLPILFSTIFASCAEGKVNVYMSSRNNGTDTVINIDSAFWSAELYALINNSKVTEVNLHIYQEKDKWSPPIDLKSQDPKVVAYKDKVLQLSSRGDKDLRVSAGSLKDKIALWNKEAKAAKLAGFEELNC